jgi:hypothetical protein
MIAAPAMPCLLAAAEAAEDLPVFRAKPIDGLAFYRKHTLGLLRRYLRLSMELGRAPSVLGKIVLRGRVSSYRLRSFEDGLIFVLDVEKCIHQLDRLSRAIVVHVALEDYSVIEAATLMRESLRSATRIYNEGIDRLTAKFLQKGLLQPNVEKLSSVQAEFEGNDPR